MFINKFIQRNKLKQLLKNLCFTGEHLDIDTSVSITSPERVHIGNYVYIGSGTCLHGRGGLTIDDHVVISSDVDILTTMHHFEKAKMVPYDNVELLRPVIIKRCVWIGMRAIIMPGVVIGEGSIIGAGAVVTRSCDPGSILGGNPASVIRHRNMTLYQDCVDRQQFYLMLKKQKCLQKIEICEPERARKP